MGKGGQRGQTRWTGQTGISCGVSAPGGRPAGQRPEGGGRRSRPGGQRAGDLRLAPPGADRSWARTRVEHVGAGGARRGETAYPRAGSGVGGASAGGPAAGGDQPPKKRFAAPRGRGGGGGAGPGAPRGGGGARGGGYPRGGRAPPARAARR